MIHSILYTLDNFSPAFAVLNQQAEQKKITFYTYQKAWCNFFDNIEQANAKEYIQGICKCYYEKLVMENEGIVIPSYAFRKNYEDNAIINMSVDSSLLSLIYILKLKQFFTEEEGQKI